MIARRVQGLRALNLVLLAVFALAMALATRAYPGGTWRDVRGVGFDFWGNYWCDLLEVRAHNGADNRLAQRLARFGFASFGAALSVFFVLHARGPRFRIRALRGLAASCFLALIAVASTSSRSAPIVHGVAVVAGALMGIGGVWLLLLWAPLAMSSRSLGLATVVSAGVAVAAYVLQAIGLVHAPWLAGLQKLVTFFLLGFMVTRLSSARLDDA